MLRLNNALWWMVLLLLVPSVFTSAALDADAFSGDELRTVLAAGGAHHGPLSFPMGVIENTNNRSPDQALGFPLIAKLWGDYAGWEEFNLRVFTWLTGLLVIAMTYRVGKDLFSPFAGFSAATVMATSVFYVTYMHKFRVFTLVALTVAVGLWCYWRLALAPTKPGWLSHVGLFVAGLGFFYTHYFATPLVGALGLFHLLFVKKDRRWWRPVVIFVLVFLCFLPALNFLYDGIVHNSLDRPDLRAESLSPFGVVERLVFFFGNGAHLFTLAYIGAAAYGFVKLSRKTQTQRAEAFRLWLVWFSAVVGLLGIILMNELAGVFPARRVRYLMPLWVPLSLVVGVGIWQLGRVHKRLPLIALAVWAAFGLYRNIQGTLMIFPEGDNAPVPAWREMTAAFFEGGEPGEPFVFLGIIEPRLGHYTHGMTNRHFIETYMGEPEMHDAIADEKRVWFVFKREWNQVGNLSKFYALLDEMGFDYCRTYWDDQNFLLRMYVASPAFCPGGEPQMVFGDQITLMQVDETRTDDTLTLNTGWRLSPDMPVNTYSVGFHLYNAAGELVTQQDIGLGTADGPYTPLQATFDLDNLPDGEYEVRVVVYDWNTGERLVGVNAQDNTIMGDMLVLERFAI